MPISTEFGTSSFNEIVRNVAGSAEVRRSVASVLGAECFAVRGIFFNKSPKANWKVTWHQDCVIAVREKLDIRGWDHGRVKPM
jgi:hypothetical protein